MEKRSFWSRNRNVLLALGLTVLVLAGFKIFGVLVYDTNDDALMASLSYGYYGTPEGRLIYIHPLLGMILAALQGLIPAVSWYLVMELGLLALSFAVLCWLILEKQQPLLALPELAILTVLLVEVALFRLQFTKIAGLATAAGILVLFDAVREKRRWPAYLLGFFLALGGFCLRTDAFLMVLLPLSGVGVYHLVGLLKAGERKRCGGLVVTFAALFAVCGGLLAVKDLPYQDAQWQAYRRYNALRSELMDYGFPDYEANQALYESLGISREDLALYKSWDFGDPERFSADTMEALVAAKEPQHFSVGKLLSCAREAVQGLMRYDFADCLLVSVLLALVLGGKGAVLLTAFELLALVGAETYLLYNGRGLRERVDGGLMLAVCAVLLLLSACGSRRQKRSCALLAAALLLTQGPALLARRDEAMERYIGAAHLQGAYRVMSQDRSKLYLTRTDELQPDLLPGRQGGLGYYSNIGTLGGWLTESPYVLERNGAYGITNPFRDAVNSEVLRIVSNDIGPVLRYIRAHYAPNAEAVEEDVINGEYTVWRIVEETSKA